MRRKSLALLVSVVGIALAFVFVLGASAQAPLSPSAPQSAPDGRRPVVGVAERSDLSAPLRSVKPLLPEANPAKVAPLRRLPQRAAKKTAEGGAPQSGAVAPRTPSTGDMPAPSLSFEGINNRDGAPPPDTNGDVGPNHYFQTVNVSFQIWDKNGVSLYGPARNNTLWLGFGGPCETTNDGDPIALYDRYADRWLMSQMGNVFTSGPYYQCIAISQTGDPTGAWYRYAFQIPHPNDAFLFADYPKFGVWPDGYYMSANMFDNTLSFGGAAAFAFERDRMLAGDPAARVVYFNTYGVNQEFFGMLPSHSDGLLAPPAGSPNYFVALALDWWESTGDALQFWRFHVDWDNPANSTFGALDSASGYWGAPNAVLPTATFNANLCDGERGCIPQPGTTAKLDAIADRLMYRLQYRNLGERESLVVNHTVNVSPNGDQAGIRWYEIRNPATTPTVHQEGTYAPDGAHRWMGSIAMDEGGNIALGYSVASSTISPSIRYAGRLAGDPSGQLTQGEATLIAGTGVQTDEDYNRWGDYSTMSVDPVDNCTFWYTQEYYQTTSDTGWRTRIGAFRFPSCTSGAQGNIQGTVRDAATNLALGGARVAVGLATTYADPSGRYTLTLPVGPYTVTATTWGYHAGSIANIAVTAGGTAIQDIALSRLPSALLSGRVSDLIAGWSLLARIEIAGYPAGPILTDPSGLYSVTLPANSTYALDVSSSLVGYLPLSRTVVLGASDQTENFALSADGIACVAPGYFQQSAALPTQTFDASTLPAGWSAIDNAGTGARWRFDNPSGLANSTGGTGNFAIADSDYEGSVNMNTELRSPTLDLSALSSVVVRFKSDFRYYSGSPNEIADVDVSGDGGANWTNVWRRELASDRGPKTYVVDISAQAAGRAAVIVRFHYYNANYDWYWLVDDVSVYSPGCRPQPGGLVAGKVTDASTGAALPGTVIADDAGGQTTAESRGTSAAPLAGYAAFFPVGTHVLTATLFGYYSQTVSVGVVASTTVRQDFALTPTPPVVVSGVVTDAEAGWPLYGAVRALGVPNSNVYSDPATGYYSLTLPGAASYQLAVTTSHDDYVPQTRTISLGTSDRTENFALAADLVDCRAPGRGLVGWSFDERFTATSLPAGWTVIDNAGGGAVWRFDNPGDLGNWTGGEGNFAVIDSDYAGEVDADTELRTPTLDFTGLSQVFLRFRSDFDASDLEVADVDVSNNGGATWTNVWRRTGQSDWGPKTYQIDISALAAGRSAVKVRFHYYDAFYAWWWQIDDVAIGAGTCALSSGGLVLGRITDVNTGSGLYGIEIAGDNGQSTVSQWLSRAHGFYSLFSPGGTHTFTATAPSYSGFGPLSLSTAVAVSTTTKLDFALPAGLLKATPGGLAASVQPGGSVTLPLQVKNAGQLSVDFLITEGFPDDALYGGPATPGPTIAGQDALSGPDVAPRGSERSPERRAIKRPTGRPAAGAAAPRPKRPDAPDAPGEAAAKPYNAGGSNSWWSFPDAPLPLAESAAAKGGGLLFLAGGVNAIGYVEDYAASFDSTTGVWTTLPSMASDREGPVAAFLNGQLYVAGGYNGYVATASMEIYSPTTNSWSPGPSAPRAFWGASAVVLDGKLYVVGGCVDTACHVGNAVSVFDPAANAWSAATNYPQPVSNQACGGIGDKIYCAGGWGASGPIANTYAFDPSTGQWTEKAPMPDARWGAAATGANGVLLVSGGVREVYVTGSGYYYDPQRDVPGYNPWRSLPYGKSRYLSAGVCGFYNLGGYDLYDEVTASNEVLPGFDKCGAPAGIPWLNLSPSGSATLGPDGTTTVDVNFQPDANMPLGRYRAWVRINNHTPYGTVIVPVTLTVGTSEPGTMFVGQVAFQGREVTPPADPYSVPLRVQFWAEGQATPVYSDVVHTDGYGSFSIADIPAGTYTITLKHAHSLGQARPTTVGGGATAVTFCTLLEGDADDNNRVNITDFSILAAAYGLSAGQGGWDARADFNQSRQINIRDFSALAANYAKYGDQLCTSQ